MKRITLAIAVFMLMTVPVHADFDAGLVAFGRGDFQAAYGEWKPLADQGDRDAQNNVGVMFERGLGVPLDAVEAVKWFRRAAEQGHSEAQNNLGVMYLTGRGLGQDLTEAEKWFRQAADQGHVGATTNLSLLDPATARPKADVPPASPQQASDRFAAGLAAYNELKFKSAIEAWRPLAESGNADAQTRLGVMYSKGLGVTRSYGQALQWFRRAADQGVAEAQFNVGAMYAEGLGVPLDDDVAQGWLRRAADQEYVEAKDYVRKRYGRDSRTGPDSTSSALESADFRAGIDAFDRGDLARALSILKPLAQKGHAKAQNEIGLMYLDARGVDRDYQAAIRWFRLSADTDLADAQFNLGLMYAEGLGTLRNSVEAKKWFLRAAEQGHAVAELNLSVRY